MSNSIPDKFSFPALLAADKEEELELSGGSITPVQSERSLSFGDYYDFAEVNSMDVVKTEEADGVTSTLMIQPPCLINIGGSGDVNSTAAVAATAEVNSAAAAAARSSSERRAKISRAKAARKLERKQRNEMRFRGTLTGSYISGFGSQSVQRG